MKASFKGAPIGVTGMFPAPTAAPESLIEATNVTISAAPTGESNNTVKVLTSVCVISIILSTLIRCSPSPN